MYKRSIGAKAVKRSMPFKVMLICGSMCFAFQVEGQAQFPAGGKSSTDKALRKEQKAAKRAAKEEARRTKEAAMLHDADYMEELTLEDKEIVLVAEKAPERKERQRTERSRPESQVKAEEKPKDKAEKESYSAAFSLEDYAKSFQGVPYRLGGMDRKGFDCSGFTTTVYAHVNVPLPRTAQTQFNTCKTVNMRKADKGDLVFFGKSKNRISHVGLVISEPGEELTMIHASSSQGIVITNVERSSYWKNKLISVGRLPHSLSED